MKAVRIHQHGGIEALRIDDLERPRPADNEVLIKVRAAALNHLDLWVRRGIPGVILPQILGSDCAGVVAEMGANAAGASGLKVGDEVIHLPVRSCGDCPACKRGAENLCPQFRLPGENCPGVQAEYASIPARYLVPKPKQLSWAEAAAFPLVGITARHMLVSKAGITSGDWALVWGASSGVGSAAIQIAKALDAHVITTAGTPQKAEFARQLGADYIIQYKTESVGRRVKEITDGRGVDVVIEHGGEQTWNESLRALAKGGKIVTCGATTGAIVRIDLRALFIKHQQIIGSTMGARNDLIKIIEMIEQGNFRPSVGQTFPFHEVRKAHDYLEQGQQTGKVVLLFD
jgi:NADPH:quinone reductase-like Zn-dependent oxidoreductase